MTAGATAAGLRTGSDSLPTLDTQPHHDANSGLQNMSEHGPSQYSGIGAAGDSSNQGDEVGPGYEGPTAGMAVRNPLTLQELPTPTSSAAIQSTTLQSPIEMRTHFADFAAQMRSHRHNEYKRRMLEHRRRHLSKAISLSRRLRRLGSWMHDGLVEISQHGDATAFVRVHQSIEDLTDLCFSQWSDDIQRMDAVSTNDRLDSVEPEPFLSKLSHSSQQDCLEFIQSVRSNPRYLVDRFKSVSPSQLKALSTSPRFKDLEASIITSLSQNQVPGRSSQRKRIQSYSKTLEDYGTSFERKNAISFLLHNCFGPESPEEDALRTNTWASVCASLWLESPIAFDAVFGQIMSEFCALHTWRARDRLELFLMDILQRGAFLLEPIGEYRTKAVAGETYVSDTLDTDGAKDFFDEAVRDLFIFLYYEDGFPLGARQLATAILGKLPTLEDQMALRGHIFFAWFMPHFLSYAIEFPEHEKMLLNFHISDGARNGILHQLWTRAQVRVSDCFSNEPSQPVDPVVNGYVNAIIAQLEPDYSVQDPYASMTEATKAPNASKHGPALTLCATDLVHILVALSQQYMQPTNVFDPVLHFSSSTFAQHSRPSNRFDRLRRELLLQMEPGSSTSLEHPCQEHWMTFPLRTNGKIDTDNLSIRLEPPVDQCLQRSFSSLDAAQEAVVRLALDDLTSRGPLELSTSPDTPSFRHKTVADLFEERIRFAQSSAQNVDHFYWENALSCLNSRYSSSKWAKNDSRILRTLMRSLDAIPVRNLTGLEGEVQNLESVYSVSKQLAYSALDQLNQLKIKMWYVREVINSHEYESARNISRALNYMALNIKTLPESTHSASSGWERPGTSASTASSMFEQPRLDAMEILKAPREHGGPRKLADPQIKSTRDWLGKNGVENFCKGEERIHRFCMEIRTTTRKLVAETLSESPVLWSSELWAKERSVFEVAINHTPSIHGSSRPPSVMSETFSSTVFSSRPSLGSTALSSKSLDADGASFSGRKSSFFSLGSGRLNREILGSEAGTAFSSPGRSLTTTSGESVSSIWSQLQSQARSMTSASMASRAPSILNDLTNLKLGDHNAEKARFLDSLQQDLIGLLLSDLGNPVWSLGSETDSWLDVARQTSSVHARMLRRKRTAELMPESKAEKKSSKVSGSRPPGSRRSLSTEDASVEAEDTPTEVPPAPDGPASDPRHAMMLQLEDILGRIKDQVNPTLKLRAVHDFKKLALLYLDKKSTEASKPKAAHSGRRRSLGADTRASATPKPATMPTPSVRTEGEIVEYLKELLLTLGPKTLFRDLQFIAAFIPLETLNKTESGKAFFQLGLAAMAGKDEYCRCMVDVADSIVSKDAIKRKASDQEDAEQPLHKARQYWILAACEGNAIAQRELASLYLAHPELPPIVSLPMTLSSDIFKDDMMWQESSESNNKTQALCLAVHWMTQAANNGDEIANKKLKERKETASVQ